jgi:hypothetical protein
MEEVQQENQKTGEKRSSGAVIVVSVLVAVYFLFPVIFLYPLFRFYHGGFYPHKVAAAVDIVFFPVWKLSDNIPAYGYLIRWEWQLFGVNVSP